MTSAGATGARRPGAGALALARALGQVGGYLALSFGTAAALATPIYRLLEGLGVAGLDYEEVAFRTLEAAAFLWVLLWLRRRGRVGPAAWGFRGPAARFGRELVAGYAAGVLTLLVLWGVLLLLEVRAYRPGGLDELPGAVAKGLVVGAVVALLEETLFRGGMQSALQSPLQSHLGPRSPDVPGWPALWLVAAVYALAHFIKPEGSLATTEVGWASGAQVFWHSLPRLASPAIVDSALCLLAAGVVLGLVRERTGRIAMSVGMHAGWVTVIFAARKVSALTASGGASGLVGTYDGVIGWVGLAVFVPVIVICRRWPIVPRAGHAGRGARSKPEALEAGQ